MGMVKREKRSMSRDTLKDTIYGAIREMANNPKFYYGGINDEFSHLTEKGEEELIVLFNKIIPLLRRSEEERMRELAKHLVYGELSDDKDHDGSIEDYM